MSLIEQTDGKAFSCSLKNDLYYWAKVSCKLINCKTGLGGISFGTDQPGNPSVSEDYEIGGGRDQILPGWESLPGRGEGRMTELLGQKTSQRPKRQGCFHSSICYLPEEISAILKFASFASQPSGFTGKSHFQPFLSHSTLPRC